MIIEIDTGQKKDLTGKQMAMFDANLREKFAELIGWSYSPITGELTLDFGEDNEEQLIQRLKDRITIAEGEGKFLKARLFDKEWTDEHLYTT